MILNMAIDPGASGGVAWRESDGSIHSMPLKPLYGDVFAIMNFLEKRVNVFTDFIFERQLGAGGEKSNPTRSFRFGEGYGMMVGVVACNSRPSSMRFILPQRWMKATTPMKSNEFETRSLWKAHLADIARKKFPHGKVTLATADALLLLDYAIRNPNDGRTV